jgi:predicted nucleic acid-binding protein
LKAFTDTNFLLSALVTRGLSAELFEILLIEAELVYSHQMQGELRDKLVNKFKLSNRMLSEVISLLVTLTKIPNSDRVVYSL